MRIPPALTAGDSATWTDNAFTDANGGAVTSATHTLTYCLRGPVGTAAVDVVGVPAGGGWSFTLGTQACAALNNGPTTLRWYWTAYAAKAGVRITAGRGELLVRPDLSMPGITFDGRSDAEKVLAAVEAEIRARATGGATVEYTIGNRSLKKEPISALLELRSRYRLIVSRERRKQMLANGQGNPQRLGIRFK